MGTMQKSRLIPTFSHPFKRMDVPVPEIQTRDSQLVHNPSLCLALGRLIHEYSMQKSLIFAFFLLLPPTEKVDVVVLGAGVIGSCAALSLLRAGQNTLLIEQVGRIDYFGTAQYFETPPPSVFDLSYLMISNKHGLSISNKSPYSRLLMQLRHVHMMK